MNCESSQSARKSEIRNGLPPKNGSSTSKLSTYLSAIFFSKRFSIVPLYQGIKDAAKGQLNCESQSLLITTLMFDSRGPSRFRCNIMWPTTVTMTVISSWSYTRWINRRAAFFYLLLLIYYSLTLLPLSIALHTGSLLFFHWRLRRRSIASHPTSKFTPGK